MATGIPYIRAVNKILKVAMAVAKKCCCKTDDEEPPFEPCTNKIECFCCFGRVIYVQLNALTSYCRPTPVSAVFPDVFIDPTGLNEPRYEVPLSLNTVGVCVYTKVFPNQPVTAIRYPQFSNCTGTPIRTTTTANLTIQVAIRPYISASNPGRTDIVVTADGDASIAGNIFRVNGLEGVPYGVPTTLSGDNQVGPFESGVPGIKTGVIDVEIGYSGCCPSDCVICDTWVNSCHAFRIKLTSSNACYNNLEVIVIRKSGCKWEGTTGNWSVVIQCDEDSNCWRMTFRDKTRVCKDVEFRQTIINFDPNCPLSDKTKWLLCIPPEGWAGITISINTLDCVDVDICPEGTCDDWCDTITINTRDPDDNPVSLVFTRDNCGYFGDPQGLYTELEISCIDGKYTAHALWDGVIAQDWQSDANDEQPSDNVTLWTTAGGGKDIESIVRSGCP